MDIGREIFIKNVRRIRYIHNELSENAHEKKGLGGCARHGKEMRITISLDVGMR